VVNVETPRGLAGCIKSLSECAALEKSTRNTVDAVCNDGL
jgi:hypothetical protein